MMRLRALVLMTALCATVAYAADLLKAGDTFPSWTLTDHSGTQLSSSTLAGKTYLLWFFPKAMTPGCTAEGDGLRDHFAALQRAGVVVIGVSFDTPQANAQFVREQQFPFRLLSDRDRALALKVGAADSPEQPVAHRISYVVGPDGKVLRAYGAVTPATHAAEVLRDLADGPH